MTRDELIRIESDNPLRGRDPSFRRTVLLEVDKRVGKRHRYDVSGEYNLLAGQIDDQIAAGMGRRPVIEFHLHAVDAAEGTQHDFDNDALLRCVQIPNVPLQPLSWGNIHYLRAIDSVGTYAADDPLNQSTATSSICFAFSHGEVWAADTSLLRYSNKNLYFFDNRAGSGAEVPRIRGIFVVPRPARFFRMERRDRRRQTPDAASATSTASCGYIWGASLLEGQRYG
jgi:hypothetical protein